MSFENVNSNPLSWPQGWKRTPRGLVKRAQFNRQSSGMGMRKSELTIADGVGRVLDELRRMGVPNWNVIISTNVPVNREGRPLSSSRAPEDPGAAVYFRKGENDQKVIAVDLYTRVADNLAAIAATLEAMRAIERHGGAAILERAFTGFQALPAPPGSVITWRKILEVDALGIVTLEYCEHQYKKLRSKYHPDKPGGDRQKFELVQWAIDQARRECR